MNPPIPLLPPWITELADSIPSWIRGVVDQVWANRSNFIRWPCEPLVFAEGCIRDGVRFHRYSNAQRERLRAAGIRSPDTMSNGPAVMAYRLAGGHRPTRESRQHVWSIHHVYDGQFTSPIATTPTVRAVAHPVYFTHSAGLVAIHPIADALADEFAYFAWLLRYEAFVRFQFDPDRVFM
jgi:hypothetical protein